MDWKKLDEQEEQASREIELRAGCPAELVAAEHAIDVIIPTATGKWREEMIARTEHDLKLAARVIENRWPAEQWPGLRPRLQKAEIALRAFYGEEG